MITKELYFNGSYVDLLPNTVIALTVQSGDIGDLRTRSADYTATINIPKTNRNRKTFGHIDLVNSRSKIPYRKGVVDYYQAGLNIITKGTGIITESDEFYKLNVYNGVVDFFGSIEGKNVDDIDFGVYETIDDTYLLSIVNSMGTFSAPVMDQGALFPAVQVLKNTTFNTMESWGNNGPGVSWETNVDLGVSAVFPFGGDTFTSYLYQEYKFFYGFKYRIQFSFDVTILAAASGFEATLDKVDLYIGNGEYPYRQLIASVGPITDVGTTSFNFDETFTVVIAVPMNVVEIYAEAHVPTFGHTLVVTPTFIKVTDIEGVINIMAPYYIPLVSYKQVIERIASDAGYSIDTGVVDTDFFERLYITYSKSKYEYPKRLIDKMGFRALGINAQDLTVTDTSPHAIEFPTTIENGDYEWYNGIDAYEVPVMPYNVGYLVKARIIVNVEFSGLTDSVDFYFTVDGVTPVITESVTIPTLTNYVFTFDSNTMTAGATAANFMVTFRRHGGAGSARVQVVESEFWAEVSPTAFGIINLSALILPTKSQKDFMRDFMMRFGSLAREKNNVIKMASLEDTISKSYLYEDWTSKRDTSFQESIKFDPKNYAQQNIFTDIVSDNAIFLNSSWPINIDDETLSESKTFYTSIMASVEQNNNNGMRLSRIQLFDRVDDSPTYISSPALLYLRDPREGDPIIRYAEFTQTEYHVSVYNDPSIEYNTTWEYFIKKYYPSLIAALQMVKTVTRAYNLTPLDIAGLDLFKLIMDDNQMYIINKVNKYVPGQATRVELFKVL